MRVATEGIMYPKDAKASLLPYYKSLKDSDYSSVIEIPHGAWFRSKCKEELDKAFSTLKRAKPSYVFVLGPLHKGRVSYDDPALVYAPCDGSLSGSDWEIKLSVPSSLRPYVCFSDDICSEEQSLEIAAPYLSLFFEDVPVCHLLASIDGDVVKKIASIIKKDFPKALVFISNNKETCCARLWKEAFADGNRT